MSGILEDDQLERRFRLFRVSCDSVEARTTVVAQRQQAAHVSTVRGGSWLASACRRRFEGSSMASVPKCCMIFSDAERAMSRAMAQELLPTSLGTQGHGSEVVVLLVGVLLPGL